MKLLFIIGDSAVGKMTVGQELAKITPFSLFHNHMTIEMVLAVFKEFRESTINRLRQVIFEDFAQSAHYGMIFTLQMAFDKPSNWDYLEWVMKFFEPYGTTFYFVELVADLETKLQRNKSEQRLIQKPSKRDIEFSEQLILKFQDQYRLESLEGEFPYEHVLKIDNSHRCATEVASLIKETFNFISEN